MLEFRVLGPLEVVENGVRIPLGGPKQRSLLAILLLHANRVVSIEQLAEDLYGDARPTSAVTQIHGGISKLRRLLGGEEQRDGPLLETRPPGYVIRIAPEQLDLHRFERWSSEARAAHSRGDHELADARIAEALALWRGPSLADLSDEEFSQAFVTRLDELHVAALELQVDVWLALGRNDDAVHSLLELIAAHPLRERLRAQLMLALYRSGRQADALATFRSAREELVERFGIEPTQVLHELHRAILTQAPELDRDTSAATRAETTPPGARKHVVLLAATDGAAWRELLSLAEPLGRLEGRELILVRLLSDAGELSAAAADLNRRRDRIEGAETRAAVFTSDDPAHDLVRLATTQNAELVIVDAPPELQSAGPTPASFAGLLESSTADVAAVSGTLDVSRGAGIFVPFGGGKHDWAALEFAALLARGADAPLSLVGTSADPRRGRRDASRLLAAAALAVERAVGVRTVLLLAEQNPEELTAAVGAATAVVTGVSSTWRRDALGSSRRALLRSGPAPVVLVHRGPRPGGLAPAESLTRFTWTIES